MGGRYLREMMPVQGNSPAYTGTESDVESADVDNQMEHRIIVEKVCSDEGTVITQEGSDPSGNMISLLWCFRPLQLARLSPR